MLPTTVRGHGRELPPWANPTHPEALKGSRLVREVDPQLIACHSVVIPDLEPLGECFSLWGPSREARGWVLIEILRTPEGQPARAAIRWDIVCHALRVQYEEFRKGILISHKVEEHNERIRQAARQAESERVSDALDYISGPLNAERAGHALRYKPEDYLDGYHAANESRKPAPVGQVISLPQETK